MILFTNNTDGTVSVSWSPTNTQFDILNSTMTPAPSNASDPTTFPISDINGAYQGYAVLHVQFGTDPNNTITNYNQALSTTTGHNIFGGQLSTVNTAPGNIVYNIPAETLVNPLITQGIYVLAYIAIAWETSNGVSGTYYALYEAATNAQNYYPYAPSLPTNLSGNIVQSDGHLQMSWTQSEPGTAPIAGYNIYWGGTPGGPYPNGVSAPISNFPIGSTSTYIYDFPGGTFPQNGSTWYFVVQAFDDGTSPPPVTVVDPNSLIFYPSPIGISNANVGSVVSPAAAAPPTQPVTPNLPGSGRAGSGGRNLL